jgi:hypothetical protein
MNERAAAFAELVFILLIFTGCCGIMSKEPNLLLEGPVVDRFSGKPIAGAIVFDDGYGLQPPATADTDENGSYSYMTWYEEHNVSVQSGFTLLTADPMKAKNRL